MQQKKAVTRYRKRVKATDDHLSYISFEALEAEAKEICRDAMKSTMCPQLSETMPLAQSPRLRVFHWTLSARARLTPLHHRIDMSSFWGWPSKSSDQGEDLCCGARAMSVWRSVNACSNRNGHKVGLRNDPKTSGVNHPKPMILYYPMLHPTINRPKP